MRQQKTKQNKQSEFYGVLTGVVITSLMAVSLTAGSLAAEETAVDQAVSYLQDQTPTAWTVIGLATAGEEPSVSHLQDTEGDKALDYATPILALAAAGEDPRSYPDTDLVTELAGYHQDGQLGDPELVNDDIFGLLALAAVGEADSAAAENAAEFITEQQKANGSWGFSVGGSGDTNTTAAAVMALTAAGESAGSQAVSDALEYLRDAQNSDGGWPYDPASDWSTDSDAASTAWVLSALHTLDADLDDWQAADGAPAAKLRSFQADGGWFRHQPDSEQSSFTPTETAYAVVTLSEQGYPLTAAAGGSGSDEESGNNESDEPEEEEEDLAPLVMLQVTGPEETVCQERVRAENALQAVKEAAEVCDYEYEIQDTDYGPYLASMAGHSSGGSAGWMYTVNWQAVSSISAGAADYELEPNDHLLWLFGSFSEADDRVEELTGDTASVPLQVTLAEEEDEEDEEEEEEDEDSGPRVSFRVTAPDGGEPSFSFSEVERGQSLSEEVVLHNDGQASLTAAGTVTGDRLFRDHLRLDGETWPSYRTELNSGAEQETELSLTVPSGYQSSGTQEGTLVFWVTPAS